MLKTLSFKRTKAQDSPPRPPRFSPWSEQLPVHQHHVMPPYAKRSPPKLTQLFGVGRKQAKQKKELNGLGLLVHTYGIIEEVVGTGTSATVWRSRKKATDETGNEALFAIKCFRKKKTPETRERHIDRVKAEFDIEKELRHLNIVRTDELFKSHDDKFYKTMEFCSGGDLYTLMKSAGKLEPAEADCFFKQLMTGVNYLHERGVIHRDLKPDNLLLTEDGTLKISDFGCSELIRLEEAEYDIPLRLSGMRGSLPYMAPEIFTEADFEGPPLDIWACGVIYVGMYTGHWLWGVANKDEDPQYAKYLEDRHREEGFHPLQSLPQAGCRNVMYCMLNPNPDIRVTVAQILGSRWVRLIQSCQDVRR